MASPNSFCPDCANDYCVSSVLPALTSVCEVMNDEDFTEGFFTDQAHPLTGDPTLAASWTGRLSNTSDGTGTGAPNVANPIRHFTFPAGAKMAAVASSVKKSLSGNQGKIQDADYVIEWDDDDDSDAKFAMYTGYQCNGNVLGYVRSGPHFYGKNKTTGAGSGVGIKGFIEAAYQVDKSATDGGGHRWKCKFTFKASCMTGRFLAPI